MWSRKFPGHFPGCGAQPAYWNGNLYWASGNENTATAEPLKAFSFNANNSGLISTTPTSVSAKTFTFAGAGTLGLGQRFDQRHRLGFGQFGVSLHLLRRYGLPGPICLRCGQSEQHALQQQSSSQQTATSRAARSSSPRPPWPTARFYVPTAESIAVFGLFERARRRRRPCRRFPPAGGSFSSTQIRHPSPTRRPAR